MNVSYNPMVIKFVAAFHFREYIIVGLIEKENVPSRKMTLSEQLNTRRHV